MADEKKVITNEALETEEKEISVENLDEVAGGGAFSNIPMLQLLRAIAPLTNWL